MRLLLVSLLALAACRGPDRAPRPTAPAARAPTAFRVDVTGAGRPVVLIPGLACGGDIWAATVQHLRADHEVHVLTLAGFAGQPAVDGPLLARARADLAAYLRDLDRPVVVGHSLGGFLALWVAATAPDRVAGVVTVDGVPFLSALMDPTTTPDAIGPHAAAIRDRMAALTPDAFAAQNRSALTAMITEPAAVDRIARTSGRSDPAAVGAAVHEIMTTDLRAAVAAIRAPTLMVAAGALAPDGDAGRELAARYEAQVAAIADHRVVVAARARHFVMLDDPAFFHAELDRLLARVR
jgi:N-formylmaleamate deformylase